MKCTFLKKEKDGGITYYDCTLTDISCPCPFPQRHCKFKQQNEEFHNAVVQIHERNQAEKGWTK